MTLTLVSGGQTGVDRGAFETAIRLGLDFGGWAPKGFRAEDGRIPEAYARRMRESTDEGYALRTRLNVQDSDATLILSWSSSPEKAGGGTWFTEKTCRQQGKQCVHLRLPRAGEEHPPEVQDGVLKWLRLWKVGVLNVAGPRESKCPGIQAATIACLRWLLEPLAVDRVRQLTHELSLIEQAQPGPTECPHLFVPGRFRHGDRGCQSPSETCDVCGTDPRNALHRTPDGPPEGLDAIQRAQLDASIREAERDIRDPVEERVRAYHDLVATAPGPIGGGYRDDEDEEGDAIGGPDHEPPVPGDPTA